MKGMEVRLEGEVIGVVVHVHVGRSAYERGDLVLVHLSPEGLLRFGKHGKSGAKELAAKVDGDAVFCEPVGFFPW